MQLSDNKDIILFFTRLGIGSGTCQGFVIPNDVDWEGLQALADAQGLSAVVMDGINNYISQGAGQKLVIPKEIRRDWIGVVIQDYECWYEQYCNAIAEMAAFYNSHGYKMMVLKGYACSLDWPRPDHRPCGDIDIWQFGQQAVADAALAAEKGVEIDSSHHHHTVFSWGDIMVENHYDFVNVHAHRSSRELEKIFKRLGADDTFFVEVSGERVYLPSPNLHALFLLRHMVSHFASTSLNMRQILDWGFFVKAHGAEVDWEWLAAEMERFHMTAFYNCLSAICVEDLGFEADIFKGGVACDHDLKQRMLNDTLSPEFSEEAPSGLLPRVMFKFRRWQANAWKQRLCYNESRWSAFLTGVWAKLLKPKSI
jgi:hypothetical protein